MILLNTLLAWVFLSRLPMLEAQQPAPVLEISGGSIGFTPIYVSVGNRTFVSVALLVSS